MALDQQQSAEHRLEELRKQLRKKENEVLLLKEISQVIGSQFNLQKVLELVAARARDLILAETVAIPVLSADQATYTYRAASGVNSAELVNASLPIEIGLCGWILRNRRPWWRGTVAQLEERERNRWEQEAGTIILVPLTGKRQLLGGIAGINKIGDTDFDEQDLELLSMFASQVSTAIENAMFFEELDTAKKRAEALREKLEESNRKLSLTNEELQHLAVHDPLTGLPNRTLILDRLHQGIQTAKRGREPLALIMIDLDHFKEVNDTLGHSVGDELLNRVSGRFQTVLRQVDTLGRLGGDEFAVVVPQADRDAARVVAEKLQSTLERPVEIDHYSFSIGASMGIATYPEHGSDPSSLLKGADVAMYAAKRNRDDYCVYDPQQDSYNPNRLELLRDLRVAIQKQDISLAFQPKLDLQDRYIVGVEALARWPHVTRGVIPPNEFIPILEKTGLIKSFALQILEQAVRYCKDCQNEGYDLSIAVNLSMYNLRDDNLPRQITEILGRHNFNRNDLLLEITESAIMNDPEHSLAVLTELDRMGVRLAVDDFGTGYSSLSYLKRLPVQQLKIDRSFVSDMFEDRDDAMIVRSTIDLAHNLGLTTVAEGVEKQEVANTLKEMHCDLAQGYLISRPLSGDDFLDYLRAGEWAVRTHFTGQAENY